MHYFSKLQSEIALSTAESMYIALVMAPRNLFDTFERKSTTMELLNFHFISNAEP
jgi:hypothetical protein